MGKMHGRGECIEGEDAWKKKSIISYWAVF
jgi:hypothetical protein